jgi:hypothetical protein
MGRRTDIVPNLSNLCGRVLVGVLGFENIRIQRVGALKAQTY